MMSVRQSFNVCDYIAVLIVDTGKVVVAWAPTHLSFILIKNSTSKKVLVSNITQHDKYSTRHLSKKN
jgi:hypothetical protein